jgi:hypothetical protein
MPNGSALSREPLGTASLFCSARRLRRGVRHCRNVLSSYHVTPPEGGGHAASICLRKATCPT